MRKLVLKRLWVVVTLCGFFVGLLSAGEYPTVDLSTLKVFEFEKVEGVPPPVTDYEFRAKKSGKEEISVYNKATDELSYKVVAPKLIDVDPQMEDRGYKGFMAFYALPNGDLLLYYYSKTVVFYDHTTEEFVVLPRSLKVVDQDYQIQTWNWHAEGVFRGQVESSEDLDFEHVLYEMDEGKAYEIEDSEEFGDAIVTIGNPGNIQGAVRIETVEPSEEEGGDTKITGFLGLYKIVEKE